MQLFLPVALLVLAGLAVLFAIGGVVYSLRSYFRVRKVRRHGKRVAATVTRIDMEYVLSIRGYTTSFFVYAEWEDPETHTVYHFKSDAGGAYLPFNHPPGSKIDVLIDPRNPRRYEVQLKFEERSYV